MAQFSIIDEALKLTAPGRGDLTSSRLEEHLHATEKKLKKFGIRAGFSIASALPEGPDATTAAIAAKLAQANFFSLPSPTSRERYRTLLLESDARLLLLHTGPHAAREAARALGIPIANVLRHFEAGIFTLEADIELFAGKPPGWKNRAHNLPVVLVAPGTVFRCLAKRLDAMHSVIGITPPTFENLSLPRSIEHVAAECVRMLRRHRAPGPCALAGWRSGGLIALEMARLLEEQGEKVAFVAMLDASGLLVGPGVFSSFRKKLNTPRDSMAAAICKYRPRPWCGKIVHLGPQGRADQTEWSKIAPQGIVSYEAPPEMLTEPNVQVVAKILAAELAAACRP